MANKKIINKEEFEKLCAIHCTQQEVCDWFEITDKTLSRWIRETYGEDKLFSEVFRQKRGKGKISLRRAQYQNALNGNTAMQIWLGKQHLGQTDKQHIQQETVQINIDGDDSEL